MTETSSSGDAPPEGRPTGVAAAWAALVDGMAAAGTAMIVILMIIICSDVVARNLFGASLPLVSELGALALVMIVYLQLATAVRHNRLARADLFFDRMRERRPRVARIMAAIFNLVGAAALALIAWSTLRVLETDIVRGEYIGVTGVMTLPTWPFRAIILFGMAIAAIQFAIGLWDAISRPVDAVETM